MKTIRLQKGKGVISTATEIVYLQYSKIVKNTLNICKFKKIIGIVVAVIFLSVSPLSLPANAWALNEPNKVTDWYSSNTQEGGVEQSYFFSRYFKMSNVRCIINDPKVKFYDLDPDGSGYPAIKYEGINIKAGESITIKDAFTLQIAHCGHDVYGKAANMEMNFSVTFNRLNIDFNASNTPSIHSSDKSCLIIFFNGDDDDDAYLHAVTCTESLTKISRTDISNKLQIECSLYKDGSWTEPFESSGKIGFAFEDIDVPADGKYSKGPSEQITLGNGFSEAFIDKNSRLGIAKDNTNFYAKIYSGDDDSRYDRVYAMIENDANGNSNTSFSFEWTGCDCGTSLRLCAYGGFPDVDIPNPEKSVNAIDFQPLDKVEYTVKQWFPYTDGTPGTSAKSIEFKDELSNVFDINSINLAVKDEDGNDITDNWTKAINGQTVTATCKDTTKAWGMHFFTLQMQIKDKNSLEQCAYILGSKVQNYAIIEINNEQYKSNNVDIFINKPVLTLTKKSDVSNVLVGDLFNYEINLDIAEAEARNLKITDTIPNELKIDGDIKVNIGELNIDGNTMHIDCGNQNIGTHITAKVPVRMMQDIETNITNTAYAQSDNTDQIQAEATVTSSKNIATLSQLSPVTPFAGAICTSALVAGSIFSIMRIRRHM